MRTPEALARLGEAIAARWHAWEWALLKARYRLLLMRGSAAEQPDVPLRPSPWYIGRARDAMWRGRAVAMAEREPRRDRTRRPGPAHPAVPEPATLDAEPAHPALALQRAVGNQAVQRQLRAGAPAPWLGLGQRQALGNRAAQRLLQRSPTTPAPSTARPSPAPPMPKARLEFDGDTRWLVMLDGVLVAKIALKYQREPSKGGMSGRIPSKGGISRGMPFRVAVARADGRVTVSLTVNKAGSVVFERVPLPKASLPYSLRFRTLNTRAPDPEDDESVHEE